MALELWQVALLIAVGVVGGVLNVIAGGGSLITVPVMVFLGLPGPVANGTNRIGILAQSITSIATFARRGFSDFRLSLSLSACTIPGAVVGALVGANLEGVWFNRALALIMLGIMVMMHFDTGSTQRSADYQPTRKQLVYGHLLMLGVGFWGGFIQIGVGFIMMPILNRVMGLDLVRTNMHKVFIVGPYTLVALLVFASQVELVWLAGIVLAVGNSIGGYLGTHFMVRSSERMVRLVLNLVLVAFIIKLLFDF
jgi:uncharacterized membrane protein YfcA